MQTTKKQSKKEPKGTFRPLRILAAQKFKFFRDKILNARKFLVHEKRWLADIEHLFPNFSEQEL